MKKTMINYMQNEKYDELYTPDYAIEPLLKYLPKNIKIWECTDFGKSNITKILKNKGYEVISTHKKDFDFLIDNPNFEFDMILTNPPYSLKDEFIKRCYEYNKPFALLLPLTSLEGIKRGNMFKEKGIQVMVFDKRIDFNGKGNCWYNTSWFCYDILPQQLMFETLNKIA